MSPKSLRYKADIKQKMGCHTDDLYLIHGLFRQAFSRAADVINQADPSDTSRVNLIANHYWEMLQFLHDHHLSEDEILWGLLKQRAPETIPIVDELKQQHDVIAQQITQLVQRLEDWRNNPTAKEPLTTEMAEFAVLVEAHLSQEEQTAKPVAAKVLKQAEWDQMRKGRKSEIPMKRLPMLLGMMLESSPKEEYRQEFWDEFPAPVHWLYRWFGQSAVRKEWDEIYRTSPTNFQV